MKIDGYPNTKELCRCGHIAGWHWFRDIARECDKCECAKFEPLPIVEPVECGPAEPGGVP